MLLIGGVSLVNKEQVCLLREIMEVGFVLVETSLYLDTHPNDDRALRIHNTNSQKLKELESLYQARYGLLRYTGMSTYPWSYINSPWPWEVDFSIC